MSTTTGSPSVASSRDRRVLDEAVDPVVARVHLEHDRGVDAGPVDRLGVVGQPGAVGRAHVDEPRARLLHHLGHTERAADLDALAAAHGHVAAGGEGGEHEQHGRRVVVDDHRRLGTAQPGEQLPDGPLARATLARRQVELDRSGRAPPGRGASGARPRLVCSSTPVALITGVSSVRRNASALAGADPGSPAAIASRAMSTRIGWGSADAPSERASASTDGGRSAGALIVREPTLGHRAAAPHQIQVDVVRLDPDLPLPSYSHDGDAGLDLLAREDGVVPAAGGRL